MCDRIGRTRGHRWRAFFFLLNANASGRLRPQVHLIDEWEGQMPDFEIENSTPVPDCCICIRPAPRSSCAY